VKISKLFFYRKINEISRYFDMLTTSFSIMEDGMGSIHEVQKHFDSCERFSKRPVSINEFSSTDLINLIDNRFRDSIDRNAPYEHAFEYLYWQAAGKDHATGKSHTC
jgi:tryptophan 2,3-dioxygenase